MTANHVRLMWEHSPKGHNIIVGFDSTNEAALVDTTK